jgi:beta-N-acetylhexosaminidase
MKVRLLVLSIFWTLLSATPCFCLETTTNDQLLTEFISKMTPQEKIGQILMLGILDRNISPALSYKIGQLHPGFLILFHKNIKTPLQTAQLIYDLQKASYKYSHAQLLVAVDQEGGDVVRIPTSPPLPTALALGRSQDARHAFAIGKSIGEILKTLGIHINLAPVLDLSDPEKNSFLQTRSFGDNPRLVADMALEFSRGVEAAGILSTAKHFPGLGDLHQDSHKQLVENPVSREDLYNHYLIPYKKLIQQNALSCVMMTHLIYPNIDGSHKPATFSAEIVNILKEKLNFKGLILTDDIEMAGAKYFKSPAERAVQSFLAGNDVLMLAWNQKSQRQAYRGLLDAYKKGIITEERLNESLEKILSFKMRLGLLEAPKRFMSHSIFAALRSDELHASIDAVLDKILKDEFERLESVDFPIDTNRVVVFSGDYKFFKNFSQNSSLKSFYVPLTPDYQFGKYQRLMKKSSLILFDVSGPRTSAFLRTLPHSLRQRTLVINSRYMGSIGDEESFLSVLQVSMKNPELGKKIALWLNEKSRIRTPAQAKD